MLRGENAEKRVLGDRFGSLVANFYAIVGHTLKLVTFTATYFQANVVIPYIIVAPYFFLDPGLLAAGPNMPGRPRPRFVVEPPGTDADFAAARLRQCDP